jgi:hypothetical protein
MGVTDIEAPLPIHWWDFGLAKAEEGASESAPWILWIRASTTAIDYDNERVTQQALKDASDYFVENGRITWEHQNETTRYDPSIIVGEPMAVKFGADGSTMVQARLYPLQPKAQDIWRILRSGGKLKASIGGSCAKRPGKDGTTEINRIYWNHLALTPYPVNDHTLVSLQPFGAFVKALGVASAAPLVMEDLQGARQRGTPAFLQRWRALGDLVKQQYPTLTDDEAHDLALMLLTRRGERRQAFTPGALAPLATERTS